MKVKSFNIKMPEDLHQKIKLLSVKEKITMKDMILKALKEYFSVKKNLVFLENFKNALYDDEPLDEEDLKALEESQKDIEEGNFKSLEQVIEELK